MIIVISITLVFIVLRFTVTLFNFISNPKITRVNRRYDDPVSILIPVRNEEHTILKLLDSIQTQDYGRYEIIIYDDQSTDQTLKICAEYARQHPRVSIIRGEKLPGSWLGKNYACCQLAKKATGKYLLFLDADVIIKNGLINSAVHRMHINQLGLLSLFPNQLLQSFGEQATVPLLNFLLLNLFPLRLVFILKNAAVAVACGQFMLFDAATYHHYQWHEKAKDKVVEDTAIMRQVKTAGYNGEILLGNGMVFCRMYQGYSSAIKGLSKKALPVFGYSILALLVYILFLTGGPMIVMMTLNFDLIFLMFGLILLSRIMTSLASGQNAVANVLLHPVQMANMAVIAFLSIQQYLTGMNVWKGRKI
ncbi:MAG TPA: glycosyltransferase family 2 protein [Mucilaginibacter sp.]|nr:glycosyltransferase family 2 protein [Mucilaginibacter sp.]